MLKYINMKMIEKMLHKKNEEIVYNNIARYFHKKREKIFYVSREII